MDEYTISFRDAEGLEHTIEGDLPSLQQQLADAGYGGPSIRVTDEPGFTRGWVSATEWRTA